MAGRVSSPRFVGRSAELARLQAVYDAALDERASTVLVAGEAGVGKTRFVHEFAQRVEASGGFALVGGCLEFVDRALPFGPIIEALRQLHRSVDDDTLTEVLGPTRPDLARLLPELWHAPAKAADDDAPTARLFEHLLTAFERLSDVAPVVLVIEDLHWADRSTRDLLVFLARNLRVGRVVVVGSYRTDDLTRRHPLRPVLAELERSGVERIDVERFNRTELREQLASILGSEPNADLVGRIHDRSDGNAFFAEELLAAAGNRTDSVSPSLRDVLLARLDSLPSGAQQVLQLAAIIGRRADHRLLAALAEQPENELLDGLREAVANQVLLTDPAGDTYQFRHALVQEVVYDDLLPGERVRLHARLAQLLTAEPSLFSGSPAALANELACHWYAAGDQRRALHAAYDAALAAEQMYAYHEALAHAERALQLWSQVPDAAAMIGLDEVALLRTAAQYADLAGDNDRSLALVRHALTLVDPAVDPVSAGMLREREARASWFLGDPAEELLPVNHEAVRLVPAEPPSAERAHVLGALGQQLMLAGRNQDAIEWCEQAIAVAQQVGARVVEGHARNTLGSVLGHLGEMDAGLAQLHEARDIARETHSWGDVARAAINESALLQAEGRHREAVDISLAGADEARRHGLDRSYGAFLRLNGAGSLWQLGLWDEMEEQLREVDAVDPLGLDLIRACEEWASLHVGRGRFDDARVVIEHDRDDAQQRPRSADMLLGLVGSEVRLLLWRGEPARVHALVADVWEALELPSGDDFGKIGCPDWSDTLLVEGIAADADVAERARARRDTEAEAEAIAGAQSLLEALAKAHARFAQFSHPPHDQPLIRLRGDAEFGRALGKPAPELWRVLGDEWERTDRLPNLAYTRWREAEARLQDGEGAAGASGPLRAAHAIGTRLGYVPLVVAVEDLARRAHIDVGVELAEPPSPFDRVGLTAREREVLDQLTLGRSNRQIADELFISTKTASVHVSNILAKFGVANRGEAVARARELGLEQIAAR